MEELHDMRLSRKFFFNNNLTLVLVIGTLLVTLTNCSVSRSSYHPNKKFAPEELHKDYAVFRGTLEESHPGLYWYKSKEEMDGYFDWGASRLSDSLNEEQFRKVLTYVAAKINCGHTIVRGSRQLLRFRDSTRLKIFPLSLKIWPDTAVVAANLNRKDSILVRGTVISKINNQPIKYLVDTLSRYISSDGYNITHKYQSLSNRSGFGTLYTSIFGIQNNYLVNYIDSLGIERIVRIPSFDARLDSSLRTVSRMERIRRSERRKRIRESNRNLAFDTLNNTAIMEVGSFGRSLGLKTFFRASFKALHESSVKNLIIDVRGNGGGSVTNSTFLTKFIATKKFKIADSLYAINRNSRYKKHIKGYFFNQLFMLFMTRKRTDGKFHFGYFERHFFKPKKNNRFDGNVYVLTGGNSFSATTLFAGTVKDQPNVFIIGEETGGGAYGNTAWLIPDAKLPVTGIRFRLPLFRLVINKDIPKDGRGVLPEIESVPTVDAIRKGLDYKMEKTMELIRNNR